MSWDVDLIVPGLDAWSGPSWNYTHNINPMINDAMTRAGIPFELWPGSSAEGWWENRDGTPAWFDVIDGRPGPEGLRIVTAVLNEWDNDPAHYRTMNPENGWGSFDSDLDGHNGGVRRVFREMAAAATTEAPIVWRASG